MLLSCKNQTIKQFWYDIIHAGTGGLDHLNGGDGFDFADYSDQEYGIVKVQLEKNKSYSDKDTLYNIEGVIGTKFSDFISGDKNANTLLGGLGHDTLSGKSGNDLLKGEEGNDTLSAGPGDDILEGGLGNDTLKGGSGSDTATYENNTQGVTVDLSITSQNTEGAGSDKISEIENLTGSNFDDGLSGNSLDNTLRGLSGDDLLNGNDGNDILEGGLGTNTLNGGEGIDYATYENVGNAVAVDLSKTEEQIITGAGTDTFISIEGLIGSKFNDMLTGNDDDNFFMGGLGNDTFNGGEGFDTADYTKSTTALNLDLNIITAQTAGSLGNDALKSIENIIGSAFADTLKGNASDNELTGGDGDDKLYGNAGNDVLDGGTGKDLLSGGNGDDALDGRLGDDTLNGGAGNDGLDGGLGLDILNGNEGNDELYGGKGDTLNGGTGDDYLYIQERGSFLLTGGGDNDTFVFSLVASTSRVASESPVISDFNTGDHIDLSELKGFEAITDLSLTTEGGYTLIQDVGSPSRDDILIKVKSDHALTTNDFVF